jgi:hypothetical protein
MSDLDLDLAIATAKAKKAKANYGTATQDEYVRARLEQLEAAGTIRPAEAAELATLRGAQGANAAEIGRTGAAYRGFAGGATLNARDNIADLFGGDGDAIRAKDAAARTAYPEEFDKGNIAGGVASMAIPGLGVGKLAQGLGRGLKTLAYGVAGGISGGASGFMNETGGGAGFTGPDLSNRLDNAKMPAIFGAGVGAVAPPLAAGGGALARLFANRAQAIGDVGPRAVSRIRPAFADTAAPGGDVAAYLRSLGDEGMIADVPGPMQSQAMGLAAMQGRGGAELSRAVNDRALSAGPRITQTMDAGITGPNAAFDLRRANAAERTNVLGPEYEAALSAPGQLDITSVLRAMDPNAVGAQRSELEMLRRNLGLDVQPGAQPLNTFINAPKLHNVRSELSDNISAATREGRGGFVAATKPALTAIDDVLNTIPGYQAARTGYANNKAMDRAIEDGQNALRGGRATASSPAEFEAQFAKLSGPQKDAFRTGLRRDIAGLMGTAKNDAASAWQEFGKTWNEEKLRIALGADAEPIITRLKAEKVFSETRGRIDAGSMTAKRTEATKSLADADPNARAGLRTDILSAAPNAFLRNVIDPLAFGPRRSRLNEDMGRALSKSGPEAQAFLADMLSQNALSASKRYPEVLQMLLQRALLGGAGGAAASQN